MHSKTSQVVIKTQVLSNITEHSLNIIEKKIKKFKLYEQKKFVPYLKKNFFNKKF